jgi:hypothetical protein
LKKGGREGFLERPFQTAKGLPISEFRNSQFEIYNGRLVALLSPFIPVSVEVPDVGFDEFEEGAGGKERAGQGIDLKRAHDLVIEALAVEADFLQGAERAMVLVIQAEEDLRRAALKGLPLSVQIGRAHV